MASGVKDEKFIDAVIVGAGFAGIIQPKLTEIQK